jgi:Gram-negative bacterial TonB protein C-terminal
MRKIILLGILLFTQSQLLLADPHRLDADTTKPIPISLDARNKPIDSNVLIVVNGKLLGTIREIKRLDTLLLPEKISAVHVWKDSLALAKYGTKAKAGVIEITLKELTITEATQTEKTTTFDVIFDKPEIEASFAGGDVAWRRYLERNINGNIPVQNKAPEGSYTVVIQFQVDKQGNISDVKGLTNHGYGMEKEVMRLISAGPKWAPAIQNGRTVNSYKKQPVTFFVMKDDEPVRNKKKSR